MVTSSNGSAEEAFAERLRDLLNEAHANGVEIEGGWPVLNEDPDLPDWDVVIVGMAKPR
jgi:hypothetical protein